MTLAILALLRGLEGRIVLAVGRRGRQVLPVLDGIDDTEETRVFSLVRGAAESLD